MPPLANVGRLLVFRFLFGFRFRLKLRFPDFQKPKPLAHHLTGGAIASLLNQLVDEFFELIGQ